MVLLPTYQPRLRALQAGLTPSPADLVSAIQEFGTFDNSPNNINPVNPSQPVYPKADTSDAPYDLSENTLRSAIHIPTTFTYGQKEPVILVPGTGNFGAETFAGNFIKLLTGVDYADPVWLNIPGGQLADLQTNTEFLAYAINYISGISQQRNVSVVSWSAGSLNMRWSGKYWPSTRKNVNNHIAISGDYHGTILADALCPGFPKVPCDPAVLQQTYDATFIKTLRANGGDSPYVPTTNVVSTFDEVVQPQENENASGFATTDAHNVGITNVEVQNACYAQAAGTLYSHEGVLYNPLAFALAKDALINGGPGQLSRVDTASECQKIVADGLDFDDLLLTEASIPIAAFGLLAYQPKVLTEPAIKPYAAQDAPSMRIEAQRTR
ncbi:alpha/beta-hydrolase [Saccharata proteae CBS 121410]|uniref:Alpha/beta-hydrolase n=1 Tax=Saccharata proteae CBS 121410 TaxID=1314787 RepID=A0A9P4HSU8_9PEZI|nr:alpha/beta-hydrolase [Saccharata proteae CBS 121410]